MNKRSTADWLDLFEQHSNSGLTAAAFCREHGLCPKYFSLRRKQLHNRSLSAVPIKHKTQSDAGSFIPVSVRPETSSVIVVQLGELTVNLSGNVAAGWLSDFVIGLRV
ncbi:MAG: IS66 family insertion sequence element accessory protein TnpB [bacterium]|nr:IS66 family insertion sequence element accessory protein TnpB [bacterium]